MCLGPCACIGGWHGLVLLVQCKRTVQKERQFLWWVWGKTQGKFFGYKIIEIKLLCKKVNKLLMVQELCADGAIGQLDVQRFVLHGLLYCCARAAIGGDQCKATF